MNCDHKTFNVFISPIKAIMYGIDDQSVDYILCTSDDRLEIGRRENVLLLRFMDITDGTQWGAFQKEQAEEVCRFLRRGESADDLFLCCDSGESRSAAIAAAVLLSAQLNHSVPAFPAKPQTETFDGMCFDFPVPFLRGDILIDRTARDCKPFVLS